ncbi:unnamed protein product [Phyllotreta striolata]|uniref:Chitin-binding type-2 domain-containing protein n=1 Tax=Phyllotreta striolata TaxID=444603 RepID=A0A9N9XR89_PHYSR|nr:unnamed protein product [Phyllotreta striolata]
MKGVSVLFVIAGICAGWSQAIFLNHRPFPTYSLENMPQTSFSCREKILGGYYADVDTQCQMFHICVKVAGIGIQDFRFLCPNGTAFDQDHQICAEWEDIDCDVSTLYYSSDNFDLYRLGSGFESKALKYGEEEEPFSLQRAETGDARLNREQQTRVVDQKKKPRNYNAPRQNYNNNNNNNNNNNDREIFKSSSSSNFYNNRNNGKERDEDYDDNVNYNQNRDYEQKRKIVHSKTRPAQNNQNNRNQNDNSRRQNNNNQSNDYNRNQNDNSRRQNSNNQSNDYNRNQNNDYNRNQNNDYNRNQNNDNNRNQNADNSRTQNRNQNADYSRNNNNNQEPVAQTRRPSTKFTGFVNNFAGSYEPTTSKPSSTTLNTDQYTTAINNYKNRNNQRHRQDFTDSPVYTISTPAPFKQQSQYNSPPARTTANNNANNNNQYYSSTAAPQKKISTTYDDHFDIPKIKSATSTTQNYNTQYDVTKTKQTSSSTNNERKTTPSQYETTKIKQNFNYKSTVSDKTENYPSNNPKYTGTFEKKSTTPYRQNDNRPTTLSPKPFSLNSNTNSNFPTTFAPRTNAVYNQIAQQTAAFNQNRNQNQSPSTFSSTPRATPFTQYTPTIPKLSSTTPVSRSQFRVSKTDSKILDIKVLRSNRFDETQYDDGSYSSKYDYDGDRRDDEFLKTAHSQNIAASRNELSRTTKLPAQQPQRTAPEAPKTSKPQGAPKPQEQPKGVAQQPQKKAPAKPVKDVSYDYAYYDSHVASEPDYEIDTEIKKSTVKN